MTKQNFIDYVRQYHYSLFYIKQGIKSHVEEKRKVFCPNDAEEASKENLVFWEFYHWTWFESGFSHTAIETFTEKDFEKTFKAIDKIADRLMENNDFLSDFKIIKKTWNRFLANLMLEFEEVQRWIN